MSSSEQNYFLRYAMRYPVIKVGKFQYEIMKSLFFPKYEQNIVLDFCPVVWHSTEQKFLKFMYSEKATKF